MTADLTSIDDILAEITKKHPDIYEGSAFIVIVKDATSGHEMYTQTRSSLRDAVIHFHVSVQKEKVAKQPVSAEIVTYRRKRIVLYSYPK